MKWFIEDNVPGARIGYHAIVDEDGYIVCEPSPMGEDNARLIAAAPDMLAALVMVRDADEDCKRDGLPTIPPPARCKIDAAIAAATGSEPKLSRLVAAASDQRDLPVLYRQVRDLAENRPDEDDDCGCTP